jgi:Pentapeptide repeats (8 copies)
MSHHHARTQGRYLAGVAAASESSTDKVAGQANASSGVGAGPKQQSSPEADGRKVWVWSSLWPWPALAIVVISVAGSLFSWPGAVLGVGVTVATLLLVAGYTLLDLKKLKRLAVSAGVALVVSLAVILVLLWQVRAVGFGRGSSPGHTSGSADLAGRTVTQLMLKGLNLRGAMLSGTKLDHLSLTHKSLNGAVAPGSSFIGSDLQKVPMRGAELPGANFSGACLRYADLAGAELNGAIITGADVTGVDLPPSVLRTLIGKPAAPDVRVPSCK